MVDNIFKSMEVVRPVEVRHVRGSPAALVGGREGADRGGVVCAGANASDVARQHDISPQHLFQWRHAAKAGRLVLRWTTM